LVIILNFMCCIGLCSNCFSYWVAHKRSICSLGTTRRTTFTIHCVFCFCILCVTNKFDLIWKPLLPRVWRDVIDSIIYDALMRGVGVFKHVYRQMLDILSNYYDSIYIYSAISHEKYSLVQ